MGKNSQYKSLHSQRKHQFKLSTIDVHMLFEGGFSPIVAMSPQEAFQVLHMPAFEGFITSMVPNYEPVPDELSEMPEE